MGRIVCTNQRWEIEQYQQGDGDPVYGPGETGPSWRPLQALQRWQALVVPRESNHESTQLGEQNDQRHAGELDRNPIPSKSWIAECDQRDDLVPQNADGEKTSESHSVWEDEKEPSRKLSQS